MRIKLYSSYNNFPTELGEELGEIPIYVDEHCITAQKGGIALLVEPPSICPDSYYYMKTHYADFKHVFTYDEELLKLPNAKLLLFGTFAVESQQEKSKGISMICSKKAFCEGHRDRQRVALGLKGKIETFGEFDGGEWLYDLGEAYKPYRFNVAMENYSGGHYFTEKICNCFSTMTVPIYYGSPHIAEYFNPDGIIQAKTPDEVAEIVEDLLTKDLAIEYEKRKAAILQNYKRVQRYRDYKVHFFNQYGDLLREEFKR